MVIRRSAITRKVRVKPRRTGKPRRSTRELNPEFLAFLHLLPCFRCSRNAYHFFARNTVESVARYVSQKTPTEAAHIGRSGDRRGLSQKYDDTSAIPLCAGCHTEDRDAIHQIGPVAFFAAMGTDRDSVIDLIRKMYAESLQ